MKVIFTDNVPGVAARGDTKNVKDGYFRNFLLPRRKAVLATEQLIKQWEEYKKRMLIEKENLHAQFEEMKRRFAGAKVKLAKKVTAKGTLYGGVKALDVVKAVKETLNMELPSTAIIIKEPIKTVGNYEITLHLGEGVETTLALEVVQK